MSIEKNRRAPRPEFEVAWYTKELGRPLQRQLLQRRFDADFKDSLIQSAHGEDEAPGPMHAAPPAEDRAG